MIFRRVFVAASLLLAADAWAIDPSKPIVPSAPATLAPGGNVGGQVVQTLFGLVAVIALIFVLAWVLRRVQRIRPGGEQVIQLLSSQSLSPRDRLVLVQVGSEQVLLGLTPGRITPLHVLKQPVEVPGNVAPVAPEFAQRLMEMLGKERKDKN